MIDLYRSIGYFRVVIKLIWLEIKKKKNLEENDEEMIQIHYADGKTKEVSRLEIKESKINK